jgi:hypothetical protein
MQETGDDAIRLQDASSTLRELERAEMLPRVLRVAVCVLELVLHDRICLLL